MAVGARNGIDVALGKGDGTFQPFTSFVPTDVGGNGSALASTAADFDGDGNTDLVLYSASGIFLLPGKGDGSFTSRTAFNLPSNEYAVGVAIADCNRDGALDLAVIEQVLGPGLGPPGVAGHVYVGLGKGDGSFPSPIAVATLNQRPNFIMAADFNHDSVPDLAIDTGTTFIFVGNGNGSFRAAPNVNLGFVNPRLIAVADWTGSGNPGLGILHSCVGPVLQGSISTGIEIPGWWHPSVLPSSGALCGGAVRVRFQGCLIQPKYP